MEIVDTFPGGITKWTDPHNLLIAPNYICVAGKRSSTICLKFNILHKTWVIPSKPTLMQSLLNQYNPHNMLLHSVTKSGALITCRINNRIHQMTLRTRPILLQDKIILVLSKFSNRKACFTNYKTNTSDACTCSNAFLVVIQNIVMQCNNFDYFYIFWNIYPVWKALTTLRVISWCTSWEYCYVVYYRRRGYIHSFIFYLSRIIARGPV